MINKNDLNSRIAEYYSDAFFLDESVLDYFHKDNEHVLLEVIEKLLNDVKELTQELNEVFANYVP